MFQRIKASIDSKIAEEQAKSRFANDSPSRAASGTRRTSSRAISPSKRVSREDSRGRQDKSLKDVDPADFEPEFVIDDEGLSRSGTPRPIADQDEKTVLGGSPIQNRSLAENGSQTQPKDGSTESPSQSDELPTNVRVKLRKLEKLEGRYQELLRSYRIAHARVQTVDSFETSLRENTPLTSISDPNAFIEYLNHLNLKGDMVLDELKRVSTERDICKQRLEEAEKETRKAWDEATKLHIDKASGEHAEAPEKPKDEPTIAAEDDVREVPEGDSHTTTKTSPTSSAKSPTITLPGMSLFSSRPKSLSSPKSRQGSEDLFSYEGEIPRLEGELQAKQERVVDLESEIRKLKADLLVTRESTQSMVQTLEEATREVSTLRESRDRSEAHAKEQQNSLRSLSDQLRMELSAAETKLQQLEKKGASESTELTEDLSKQLEVANSEIETLRAATELHKDEVKEIDELQQEVERLGAQLSESQADSVRNENQVNGLTGNITLLRAEVQEAEEEKSRMSSELEASLKTLKELESKHDVSEPNAKGSTHDPNSVAQLPDFPSASKKKGKKKKKGAKSATDKIQDTASNAKSVESVSMGQSQASKASETEIIETLRLELQHLQSLLEEKDAAIEIIQGKLKDQEGLRDEIETLRDEIVNVGQENVEAKDRVKTLIAEKSALEQAVMSLEEALAEARIAHDNATAGSEQKQKDLATQFDELKVKASTLQTDLSAAQQLASSRFKDLNALRAVLQNAQPEINALRSEAAEMKTTKEALSKKEADFQRLNAKHEELRAEVSSLKQTVSTREAEVKSLNQLNSQEASSRARAEDISSKAQQDMSRLEAERHQAADSLDRVSKELGRVREELATHKARLRDVEQHLSKHRSDTEGLKEEIELKSAQYASAQSLMASMRDQTAEMAMQMKEARDRCESLDEEVADAHRLLGERSREGETMRRLLAEVEGRADARTREMKERMDTALEERDRAEEEASTAGRRRARELEDFRNKYRDLERSLKRAEEGKEELEMAQREWKRRREELEYRTGQSTREVDAVKRAMGELRDALDESEKQARELEKHKAELRRSVEDSQHRLEKLQKSNKSMADEISKVREGKAKARESETQSSRTSIDSTPRTGSPAPPSRTGSGAKSEGVNGQTSGTMDYVYLKNVLLQFLEQKDKKHQMQLIPVLGMLLHFDRKDEQKWMSAVATKG